MRVGSVMGAVSVGLVAVLAGCGGDERPRLTEAELTMQLQAACADFAATRDAELHAVAGATFTRDSLDTPRIYASEAYELLDELRGPEESDAARAALREAIDELSSNRLSLRTNLEVRDLDDAAELFGEADAARAAVDERAADLGVPECASETWVGDWYDQARIHLDALVEATTPTGDFLTDIRALCTRFNEDVTDTLPFGSIEAQLWAFSMKDALRLFARDLDALRIPEGQRREVAALHEIIDQLTSDLTAVINRIAGSNQKALDEAVDAVQAGISDFQTALADLDVTNC